MRDQKSDPGLQERIFFPMQKKSCYSFSDSGEDTLLHLTPALQTGTPKKIEQEACVRVRSSGLGPTCVVCVVAERVGPGGGLGVTRFRL